ncbi:hypothetical protein AB0G15_42680 [Streptosporangium sp. NPDC023825]
MKFLLDLHLDAADPRRAGSDRFHCLDCFGHEDFLDAAGMER